MGSRRKGILTQINPLGQMMKTLTLFLCGDVMTGRGIDQILPHPCDPVLYEPFMRSALGYVELAERDNGPIPRRVDPAYVWGDALEELERERPAARIVNLETAVTQSDDPEAKGINYRMHPANAACLSAAKIDCCVLANNHVLDWGIAGLTETLRTLEKAGIRTAGAGANRAEARSPAELPLEGGGRVLVFALAAETSGVPPHWAAATNRPGVDFLEDLSQRAVARIAGEIRRAKRPGDVAVVSLHWGSNWDYRVSEAERRFAHALIDAAGADLVHGHSPHHAKGIEVHAGKLIVYGCGDFINDYEGISGHEEYRGDLGSMYFPTLDLESGRLVRLELVPTRMRRFRVERAGSADRSALCAILEREGRQFGTHAKLRSDGRIEIVWGR
jgi:poly-gamma-glutamate synthesis protein (capsule biosynthesis protein)